MPWFSKKSKRIETVRPEERVVKTENVFVKCDGCEAHLYTGELDEAHQVCKHCGYHFRIGARERLGMLYDEGKFEELDEEVISIDPLEFVDSKPYPARLTQAKKSSGLSEAIINARGKVGNHLVFAGAMDMSFIGGSMGSAVGEKVTRLIERALKEHAAVVIFSASGGARMQEGTLSLMQMAKISAALATLDEAQLPFVSVLTDPTTGGVTASFAMLGDFIIAEPKALIGFAGPRVIEQTIRQKLPKDFQKSEFLLEHGMLDAIVDRREVRDYIIKLLNFTMNPEIYEPVIEKARTGTVSEQ
ncbi:MAG: acetyl-CoA carboxylase carboxyltransferase subunit beta [Pyrinomonadaceae bacterium]|jgi:acetyl-CoA carboxylase carboxyl transferase subunit beta|nr:acetyl-CoA carboxylase carboxyltransferase subunit beta [Pyrinomonadaceae bacterium]MBA3572173.1 acetyl-CoA carboxylase carboxyltransferase subunit beta [Pyrinomonadaceae bacterium]